MITPTLIKQKPQVEPKCRGRRFKPGQLHCRYGVAPRNFFGAFAQTPVALPAPVFANRTTGGITTGFNATISLPTELDAGELIVIMVGGSRAATATTAMNANGGNAWTKVLEVFNNSGGTYGFLSVWARFGIIGDVNPTFGLGSGNTNLTWVAERWTGVGSFSSGLTGVGSVSGSATLNLNAVTPTVDNSIILSVAGGRTVAGGFLSSFTWGGGATAAYSGSSGRIGFVYNAKETLNAGVASAHTFAFTNGQGAPVTNAGSLLLSPT
jgi:hypothetical protein